MSSDWLSITPYSLFDLAVFTASAPLAATFYLLYWKVSRRSVDLIFAITLLCVAIYSFGLFMLDNADAPLPALNWTRVLYAISAAGSVLILHFTFLFIGKVGSSARKIIAVFYAISFILFLITLSPLFLRARIYPIGDMSWYNVAPWLPEIGTIQLVYLFYTLIMACLSAYILHRHIRQQTYGTHQPDQHAKRLLFGLVVMVATNLLDAILATAEINTISFGLIGTVAVCLPAAVALGDQVLQQTRLKEALLGYVGHEVTDEIVQSGLQMRGRDCDVTILFSDIRDFTTMAAISSPEEIVRFLNQYFEEMSKPIYQNGGMFNKTIGDGLLAVFGAFDGMANHALSAVKTAWEMMTVLETINRERDERGMRPVHIGIGLHSGRVVVGNVGSKDHVDYTVIGNVVNIASRVEQYTKVAGHPILITEATYKKAKASIRAEPAGSAPISPGANAVPVLAVIGIEQHDS
jgi:class 3 adenylate cyclase